MAMKRTLAFFFTVSFFTVNAQVKQIDKLEMLYDQGHYGMVYRKANRLLDIPDYDYSYQPEFYKSLALFRLSEKDFWFRLHPDALQEGRRLYLEVRNSTEGAKVFNAHLNHIAQLKKDLVARAHDLKKEGRKTEFDELQQIIGLFDHIPDLDDPSGVTPAKVPDTDETEEVESLAMTQTREGMIDFAKTQLGVPYLWAGDDPNGFDCSGFTQYVYAKQYKKEIPRRAEDQYNKSKKIKQRNAHKGDLVFFDAGSGISHVGMIVSEKGEPLVMIHASSSQGIVITNIEESEYWLKRLYAFGTYIE